MARTTSAVVTALRKPGLTTPALGGAVPPRSDDPHAPRGPARPTPLEGPVFEQQLRPAPLEAPGLQAAREAAARPTVEHVPVHQALVAAANKRPASDAEFLQLERAKLTATKEQRRSSAVARVAVREGVLRVPTADDTIGRLQPGYVGAVPASKRLSRAATATQRDLPREVLAREADRLVWLPENANRDPAQNATRARSSNPIGRRVQEATDRIIAGEARSAKMVDWMADWIWQKGVVTATTDPAIPLGTPANQLAPTNSALIKAAQRAGQLPVAPAPEEAVAQLDKGMMPGGGIGSASSAGGGALLSADAVEQSNANDTLYLVAVVAVAFLLFRGGGS